MSTPYLGEIRAVGFTFPPVGWVTCNGQLLSISDNDALFALIGTTYGGDGQTTFAVPSLSSRVAVGSEGGAGGPGLSTYQPGQSGGAENVTVSTNQLPAHGHPYAVPLTGSNTGTLSSNPVGGVFGTTGTNPTYVASQSSNKLAGNAVANGAAGAAPANGGQPHTNMSPVLALNYIICTQGIFPPQN